MNDQRRYGFLGALLGDAAGVPFEFSTKSEMDNLGQSRIDFPFRLPSHVWDRAHKKAPQNAWSDDGAQILALMDSLIDFPDFSLDDFASKLKLWYTSKNYSVDDNMFDIGNQTRAALRNLMSGVSPEQSGPAGETQNGNGGLMRSLGVVFAAPHLSTERLIHVSMDASLPTHAHITSQVCCALLNTHGANLSQNINADIKDTFRVLREFFDATADVEALREVDKIWAKRESVALGGAYVVDTFWGAILCAQEAAGVKEAIQKAIMFGGDTDTTACVAGGLAGLRFGADGFPFDWIEHLPRQPDFCRVSDHFFAPKLTAGSLNLFSR